VKKIQNKYIIEYLACWFGKETRTLNIITTHLDTLEDFIGKVKTLRWRIIKKWAKQILRGLDHLHQQKPEIVHRNVTCSHVYIDGGSGTTNIGDLWLAAILVEDQDNPIGLSDTMMQQLAQGSPAYIAPESFDNGMNTKLLTTKVDIYSFGMCVLEMITREEPYYECRETSTGTAISAEKITERIRRKVCSSVLPVSLSRIRHPLASAFIKECLKPSETRLSASELLLHEFLIPTQDDDGEVVLNPKSEKLLEVESDADIAAETSHINVQPSDDSQIESENGRNSYAAVVSSGLNIAGDDCVRLSNSQGKGDHNSGDVPSEDNTQPEKYGHNTSTTKKSPSVSLMESIGNNKLSDVDQNQNYDSATGAIDGPMTVVDGSGRTGVILNNDRKNDSSIPHRASQPFKEEDRKTAQHLSSSSSASQVESSAPSFGGPDSQSFAIIRPQGQGQGQGVTNRVTESPPLRSMQEDVKIDSYSAAERENRLGKVLEDFEQGENVYMDKGVQDGRAEEELRDDATPHSMSPIPPSIQVPDSGLSSSVGKGRGPDGIVGPGSQQPGGPAVVPAVSSVPRKSLKSVIETSQLQQQELLKQSQQQQELERGERVLPIPNVPTPIPIVILQALPPPLILSADVFALEATRSAAESSSSTSTSRIMNRTDTGSDAIINFDGTYGTIDRTMAAAEGKTSCSLIAIPVEHTNELHLLVKIPAAFTKDLSTDKEVEFSFDSLKDNIEVIAEEMILELGLTFQVSELAQQISRLIQSVKVSDSRTASGSQAFLRNDLSIVLNPNAIGTSNNSINLNLNLNSSANLNMNMDNLFPLGIITPRLCLESDGAVPNSTEEPLSLSLKEGRTADPILYSKSESENFFVIDDVILATRITPSKSADELPVHTEDSTDTEVRDAAYPVGSYAGALVGAARDEVPSLQSEQSTGQDTSSCAVRTTSERTTEAQGDTVLSKCNTVTDDCGSTISVPRTVISSQASPSKLSPPSTLTSPAKSTRNTSMTDSDTYSTAAQSAAQAIKESEVAGETDRKSERLALDLSLGSSLESPSPIRGQEEVKDAGEKRGRDKDRDKEGDRDRASNDSSLSGDQVTPSLSSHLEQFISCISSDSQHSKDRTTIEVTPRYNPQENGTVQDRTYDTQSEESSSSTQSRPPQPPQLSCESRSQSLLSLGSVGTNRSEPDQSAESPLTAASVEPTPVPIQAPPLPPSIEAETEAEARDDVDMLKEVEKMDKESRVARRAFEQRIQKHKLIQVNKLCSSALTHLDGLKVELGPSIALFVSISISIFLSVKSKHGSNIVAYMIPSSKHFHHLVNSSTLLPIH
jgi:Protein kinase domain